MRHNKTDADCVLGKTAFHKSRLLSRRSRRLIIAQHFSAGRSEPKDPQSVKRTAELSNNFSSPLSGLHSVHTSIPALKCWFLAAVPLRGTVFGSFCAMPWDPLESHCEGGFMRAYVITTGALFGLLTIAHVVKIILERRLIPDPVFIIFTLISAVLTIWAWRVLRS
jgi:hypothetical protein